MQVRRAQASALLIQANLRRRRDTARAKQRHARLVRLRQRAVVAGGRPVDYFAANIQAWARARQARARARAMRAREASERAQWAELRIGLQCRISSQLAAHSAEVCPPMVPLLRPPLLWPDTSPRPLYLLSVPFVASYLLSSAFARHAAKPLPSPHSSRASLAS